MMTGVVAHGHSERDSDKDKMSGTWRCVSAVNGGKPLAQQIVEQLRLTLTKDGGYKTERGKQVLFDSTYRIESRKSPKQIDIIGTEGENKGKTAQGIYEIEGDTLKLCYTMPGEDRPEKFESKEGSAVTLIIWKRAR